MKKNILILSAILLLAGSVDASASTPAACSITATGLSEAARSITASTAAALKAKPKSKTETVTYVVSMHCKNCVNKITDKISFMKGVKDLKVSLKDKTVTIKYDPAVVQESTLEKTIRDLGYTADKQCPASEKQ
jgi:copper chaperone CopZ